MLRRRDVDRARTEIRLLRAELQDALERLGALERSLNDEDPLAREDVDARRTDDDSLVMDARWLDEFGRIDDDWLDFTALARDETNG